MDCLISVIIPVYNVEKYLRQCLDSIINQTYRNLEIIIIDDGSFDGSGCICNEFAQRDSRITVVHKKNEGVQKTKNVGIMMAKGEWITFVDSDDWCENDYYEQMLRELDGREADVFISGGMYLDYLEKRDRKINFPSEFDYSEKKDIELLMAKVLYGRIGDERNKRAASLASQCDKLYRKDFLLKNNFSFDVNVKVLEDVFFNFCVLGKAKRVIGGQYIGYHYRQVASSTSHVFSPQREEHLQVFLEKVYSEITSQENRVLLEDAFQYRCLFSLFDILKLCYFNADNPASYWENARDVKFLKKKELFRNAIFNRDYRSLSKTQKTLKMLLKLPCIWPIAMAFWWKERNDLRVKPCYSTRGGYRLNLPLPNETVYVKDLLWMVTA